MLGEEKGGRGGMEEACEFLDGGPRREEQQEEEGAGSTRRVEAA